jgi:hypothetical protein
LGVEAQGNFSSRLENKQAILLIKNPSIHLLEEDNCGELPGTWGNGADRNACIRERFFTVDIKYGL